jgi:hypothetical protein
MRAEISGVRSNDDQAERSARASCEGHRSHCRPVRVRASLVSVRRRTGPISPCRSPRPCDRGGRAPASPRLRRCTPLRCRGNRHPRSARTQRWSSGTRRRRSDRRILRRRSVSLTRPRSARRSHSRTLEAARGRASGAAEIGARWTILPDGEASHVLTAAGARRRSPPVRQCPHGKRPLAAGSTASSACTSIARGVP